MFFICQQCLYWEIVFRLWEPWFSLEYNKDNFVFDVWWEGFGRQKIWVENARSRPDLDTSYIIARNPAADRGGHENGPTKGCLHAVGMFRNNDGISMYSFFFLYFVENHLLDLSIFFVEMIKMRHWCRCFVKKTIAIFDSRCLLSKNQRFRVIAGTVYKSTAPIINTGPQKRIIASWSKKNQYSN